MAVVGSIGGIERFGRSIKSHFAANPFAELSLQFHRVGKSIVDVSV
jgi:hypothetical protein